MAKQKRSTLAHFMNTTPDETNPTYDRLGDGITDMSMQYNPNTVTEQYIHQDNANTQTESYAPTMPVEQAVWPGDDVYDFVEAIRVAGPAVLAAAATDILEVRLYGTPDTGGTVFPATKWPVSIQLDSTGGPGGESAKIGFTINITGDSIPGSFDTTDSTFTADT